MNLTDGKSVFNHPSLQRRKRSHSNPHVLSFLVSISHWLQPCRSSSATQFKRNKDRKQERRRHWKEEVKN